MPSNGRFVDPLRACLGRTEPPQNARANAVGDQLLLRGDMGDVISKPITAVESSLAFPLGRLGAMAALARKLAALRSLHRPATHDVIVSYGLLSVPCLPQVSVLRGRISRQRLEDAPAPPVARALRTATVACLSQAPSQRGKRHPVAARACTSWYGRRRLTKQVHASVYTGVMSLRRSRDVSTIHWAAIGDRVAHICVRTGNWQFNRVSLDRSLALQSLPHWRTAARLRSTIRPHQAVALVLRHQT